MSPAANSSSRWCPTPEQLMILEEMYRTGTRTPNASQIQQITAHLSFYGKIEGKNVFYWFQNHKARDRQKLRRKLYKQLQQQQVLYHHHHHHHQQHQHMMMMNSNNIHQNNHHFVGYTSNSTVESPVNYSGTSAISNFHHQQLSCYNSPSSTGSIPDQVQGTGVFEDHNHASSTHNHHHHHHQMMSYAWKMESPAGADHHRLDQKENSIMMRSMYDRDWTMMLDVGQVPNSPVSSCNTNNNKPLKTLQLFPITATNLKEEDCTTSSKHDDLDLSAN